MSGNELWVTLLEKAFARMCGSTILRYGWHSVDPLTHPDRSKPISRY